jgi:cation diffusion facilitator CzcD-associated flavoprotein CzcO
MAAPPSSQKGSEPMDIPLDGPGKSLLETTHAIYQRERAKRLRDDGPAQYIAIPDSDRYAKFAEDPWNDPVLLDTSSLLDAGQHRILIAGGGYTGLLYAVRFLQAGFTLDDVILVDSAGGFGGTWYWNRYPGAFCDVESYIYMPLLEETQYMPKYKYAPGSELRNYANLMASQWRLHERAVFRTTAKEMTWDNQNKHWIVQLTHDNKEITLSADFVVLATGVMNIPKLPDVPGIEEFGGHIFHASRWDYRYTGGSPDDPTMTELKDKRVAIIGTAATAVQAVPQLAKWCQRLYVIQRTPVGVDRRDNRPTDPEWWTREVVSRGKGWHKERMENFNAFPSNVLPKPPVDMVQDGWTGMPGFSNAVGGPANLEAGYVEALSAVDLVRQERIRQRVDEIVQDKATAERLKPWYQTWCKRPCFHDEYLAAFNRENVTLIDTDGKGIDRVTSNGVVVGDSEFGVDLIIFSTGFAGFGLLNHPGSYARMSIIGRGGKSIEQKWRDGVATLHGVVSRDFPNLFLTTLMQASASPNIIYVYDQLAMHTAYIVSEAVGRGRSDRKVSVEPSHDAEEAWTTEIIARARGFAGVVGCTPSFFNAEGQAGKSSSIEEAMKRARMSPWGHGVQDWVRRLEEWRNRNDLDGLEIRYS